MWLDLRSAARAPDRRPVAPADLTSGANIPTADADAIADLIGEWWTAKRRELWANTWVARVPGQGHQWLEIPRYPIWDEPVVNQMSGTTAGAALDTDTYRVAGTCRNLLYRETGWGWTAPVSRGIAEHRMAGLEQPLYRIGTDGALVTGFRAGYVMPGEIATWAAATTWLPKASTSYDSGTDYGWARSSDRTVPGLFEVTAGSGAESSEPTWPTTDGDSVVGANATFTLRLYAEELPEMYVTASLALAPKLQALRNEGTCPKDGDLQKILSMVEGSC